MSQVEEYSHQKPLLSKSFCLSLPYFHPCCLECWTQKTPTPLFGRPCPANWIVCPVETRGEEQRPQTECRQMPALILLNQTRRLFCLRTRRSWDACFRAPLGNKGKLNDSVLLVVGFIYRKDGVCQSENEQRLLSSGRGHIKLRRK